MWTDFSGRDFGRVELTRRIASLKWTSWKPIGIVLHNTSAPTLAQWAENGPNHAARIKNLEAYYEGMGWKGGPHWFVSREHTTEFSNPLRNGTHSPSYNKTHFGIEMVGEYEREPFDSGDGAKVRDNAVYLMALLCQKFGWEPAKVIKFHKEDPATTHKDCPGKLVKKPDVIARVAAELARVNGDVAPSKRSENQPHWLLNITATEFGGANDRQPSAYPDIKIGWPNRPGCALPFKFPKNISRPRVRVRKGNLSVDCDIADVGPWNIDDAYWNTGDERPRSETQFINKRRNFKGELVANDAGIDLTPTAAKAIKLGGKGKVDWSFIPGTGDIAPVTASAPSPQAVATASAAAISGSIGTLMWLDAHWFVTVVVALCAASLAVGGLHLYKKLRAT